MRFVFACCVLSSGCSILTDLSPLSGGDAGAPDVQHDGADAGPYAFSDDFNRPDAGDVGNQWLTKQTAFVISSDVCMRYNPGATFTYRDFVVYRPAGEAAADVEASVEVRYATAGGWPQIDVRAQSSTVGLPDTLDGYLLFPSNGGTTSMDIARNRGTSNYVTLTTFQLASALDTSHTFRFTLRASGMNPTSLIGTVERYDAPSWTVIGTSTFQDGDPAQLGPGVVGFSAGGEATGAFSYDNFQAHSL